MAKNNLDLSPLESKTYLYWTVSRSYYGRSADPLDVMTSLKILGGIELTCGPHRKVLSHVDELRTVIVQGGRRGLKVG